MRRRGPRWRRRRSARHRAASQSRRVMVEHGSAETGRWTSDAETTERQIGDGETTGGGVGGSKWLHRDSGKAVRRWWRGHSLASRDEAETGKLRPDPRGGREPPRGKLVGRGRACLTVDFQTVGKSSPGTNSARCSSPGKRRGCPRGFDVPNEPLGGV